MNIKKVLKQIREDIMKYGEDKTVVMKIQEAQDESIMYQYEFRDDENKYILPRKMEDGWTWKTTSLGNIEMYIRYELKDRKSKFELV